jgi:hypothetical protein
MIHCPLLSILRTRKTSDGPLVIGGDLTSFAISDTAKGRDVPCARNTPLRAN